MRATYRIDVSFRDANVSNGKYGPGPTTVLPDWWREMRANGYMCARHFLASRLNRAITQLNIVEQKGWILVVEPDDLILGLLERWLGAAGYTVVMGTWQSPPQAVEQEGEPHLIIVDVPTLRNVEKIIESVKEAHASPILLLSTSFRRGAGSSMAVARQLGVRNVLPKPFTRGELLSAVSKSIEGR
jgi:CheY-like chemotaxis protein